MTALPPASDFTGAPSQGVFQDKLLALHDYLTGLLGADGLPATARAALLASLAADVNKSLVIDAAGTPQLAGPSRAYGKNAITNPDGRIAQRALPALSTVYQFGVDRWYVAAGAAVTAGTLFGSTTANTGMDLGYYFGTTISSTPVNSVIWRQRIGADEARRFSTTFNANRRASLQFRIGTTAPAGQTVQVTINKPNVADTYGAGTQILTTALAVTTSANSSVPNAYAMPNLNLGSCETGLELVFSCSVPAGAAALVYGLGDVQLEEGPICTDLAVPIPVLELLRCYRRHYEFNSEGVANFLLGVGYVTSSTTVEVMGELPVEMPVNPTISFPVVGNWTIYQVNPAFGPVPTAMGSYVLRRQMLFTATVASGLTIGSPCKLYGTNTSARCVVDCEL